jgi:hypothetical protein
LAEVGAGDGEGLVDLWPLHPGALGDLRRRHVQQGQLLNHTVPIRGGEAGAVLVLGLLPHDPLHRPGIVGALVGDHEHRHRRQARLHGSQCAAVPGLHPQHPAAAIMTSSGSSKLSL